MNAVSVNDLFFDFRVKVFLVALEIKDHNLWWLSFFNLLIKAAHPKVSFQCEISVSLAVFNHLDEWTVQGNAQIFRRISE